MAWQGRFVELKSELGRWRYSTLPGTSGLRGYPLISAGTMVLVVVVWNLKVSL